MTSAQHQAYKGIATEYNTTHQAVSETAGQILSYKGGVVESLYGATQAIVDNAHKGVGMSQTGAYAYATQEYDYQQILGIYYPRLGIARRFGKAVVAHVLFQLAVGKRKVKLRMKFKLKIKINTQLLYMNQANRLMATVYMKGGNDVQVPIEELADYLHDNADKIETRHRERRGLRRNRIVN